MISSNIRASLFTLGLHSPNLVVRRRNKIEIDGLSIPSGGCDRMDFCADFRERRNDVSTHFRERDLPRLVRLNDRLGPHIIMFDSHRNHVPTQRYRLC